MSPLLYLEYNMQGIFDRSEYLKGKETVENDTEGADALKPYQLAEFIGDS
jgi:hypothetical protein